MASGDEGWAVAGRQAMRATGRGRPQAVAERPLGMRKAQPVMQTTGSKARSSASTPSTGQRGGAPPHAGPCNARQQPASAGYGLLADADEDPQHPGRDVRCDQAPAKTTSPAVFASGTGSGSKRIISAQEAAIPDDTVEKLLAAARAMYQQNMGVKTAAKKYNVTVQGLRHFWDTNGGAEICKSQPKPAQAKAKAAAKAASPAAPAAESSGHACSWHDEEDDDDQWY